MIKSILAVIFATLLIVAGVNHFVNPAFYNPFIPDFLPKNAVNYVAGFLEFALGVGLLIPRYRSISARGVFVLMIVFLPLHVMDVFIENPAIGSKTVAYIRLPLQFVLIYWAYFLSKRERKSDSSTN